MGLLAGVPLVSGLLRRPPPPPPVLATLPPFTLSAPSGEPIDREALAGRAWVVGFVDLGCVACAERLTGALERLQYRLRNVGPTAGLLAVGVGGASPAVDLALEAARHHANPRQWRVALGPGAAGLLAAVRSAVPARAAMLDSAGAVVLVDGAGRVRAVEAIETREGADRLMAQMTLLLNVR